MRKRALISIDYTNDFVADDGLLTCGKPAQIIEEKICAITREFIEKNDFVVFAIDCHKIDDTFHPETKLFPPHNVKYSEGRKLFGSIQELYNEHKQENNVYYMDKTRYSAFAGTNLDVLLREREVTELHFIGVCTDICVLHTAVDAYNRGYKLVIYKDAVASFNQAGHEWALQHFESVLGAVVK